MGSRDPLRGLANVIDAEAGDLCGILQARLVGRHCLVEVLGRSSDEVPVDPTFLGDVGEPCVEEREVGSRVDRQVQHLVLARFDLAGIHRYRSSRVDENDSRRRMRFAGKLRFLLVHRSAAQVRHPVVEEVIGLGFERVCSDRDDRVGEFSVLVAIVEFANAHVAGRVDLGVVGWAIMDPNVLDLHRPEIELSRAPGVFVAAAGAAVIEGRDEQAVLALGVDHRRRHARHEVERVVPARRLHLAIAPYHRLGQALLLRRASFGKDSSAMRAPRIEPSPEFTTQSWSGLMTM